ncbi:hypothetical protein E2P81_ATG06786 [Venturia nashicola]|nr:hypothetical protein E2P81_ATG06786 [Venturia nashicola]
MKLSLCSVAMLFTAGSTAQGLWGKCHPYANVCQIEGYPDVPCNVADKCAAFLAVCYWNKGTTTADCYGFGF